MVDLCCLHLFFITRRAETESRDRLTQRQPLESRVKKKQDQKSKWRGGDRQTDRQAEKTQRQFFESRGGEHERDKQERTGVHVCQDNLNFVLLLSLSNQTKLARGPSNICAQGSLTC